MAMMAVLFWSMLCGAHAANLLDETRGVVGRGVDTPPEQAWAEALVDTGQWDEAMIAWQGIAFANQDADAALWAIVSAVRGGDHDAAQAATFMAMEISQADPRVLLAAAWLLNEGGAHREAEKLVRDYPLSAPDAEGALIIRMRALMMSGKTRKAHRVRRQAMGIASSDAWFWLEIGLEDAWQNEDDATEHLWQATRARHASPLHYQVLAMHLAERDAHAEAIRAGIEGLQRFPEFGSLSLSLLEIARYGPGRAALEERAAAEPDNAIAQALLGTVLFADGLPGEAAERLKIAVDGGQDQPTMYQILAEAHLAAEQEEDAWDTLVVGVTQHPDERRLWQDLYRVSYVASRQSDALGVTEDAWQRGVHRAFLVDFAFQAASDIEELELALQWSDRGLGLPDRGWLGLSQRALALTRLGRGREALHTYEEALQLRPSEPQLLNNLAWFLLEPSGDVEPDLVRARSLAEAAVKNAAEPQPAYLDTLARALWEQGEHQRAIELQRQAAVLAPDNEHIRNTLQLYETSE